MNLCILVTHLLGTGHLRRAAVLGRAAAQADARVTILSGGMPVEALDTDGVELVQLPPLRSDGVNFTTLLDADGAIAYGLYKQNRIALIRETIAASRPDVLLTELYPFGRRVLADEFRAAIETARALPRPAAVVSSIRDILAPPSKPKRVEQTEAVLAEFYDAVLVHSDPAIVPLSASWPASDSIAERLRYTGFVAPAKETDTASSATLDGTGEIIVSAGGGNVGLPLFTSACGAARLLPNVHFRLLVGAEAMRATLSSTAPANVTVEPLRPDFRALLSRAACSLSMCGYNTAMDILQTGVPALFVPFDEGNEVEQTLRAQSLAKRPAIAMMQARDLEPAQLAAELGKLCAAPRRQPDTTGFDGARRSVEILKELADARPS